MGGGKWGIIFRCFLPFILRSLLWLSRYFIRRMVGLIITRLLLRTTSDYILISISRLGARSLTRIFPMFDDSIMERYAIIDAADRSPDAYAGLRN